VADPDPNYGFKDPDSDQDPALFVRCQQSFIDYYYLKVADFHHFDEEQDSDPDPD
jgi:hypothetical protein